MAPKNNDKNEIDEEWILLIKEALAIGISAKQIRDFLDNPSNYKIK